MDDNKMSNVYTLKSEALLPPGKLISATGDELELTEKLRKEILIWELDPPQTEVQSDKKFAWIFSLKGSFHQNNFLQAIKKAKDAGYTIVKQGIVEPNTLNSIYDRRLTADNQKATSDDSIVVGLFEVILQRALADSVSDIHIEVRPTNTIIRMRKNGEMMEYNANNRLSYNEGFNLCSVLYNVLATTKSVSFDARDCQQAAINYNTMDQDLKLRYQSVPAYPDGFDVILRVLPVGRSEDFVPLQKLGYTEQQVQELVNISSRPVGSLIIAGITGSGKSTTLKNLLMYINAHAGYKIKIYSIEDPPEYNIARITQIPVVIPKDFDPSTGTSPFEKPIKACMRGDPDIIMIGEVRDKITGDLTKKAVQSGHQVLTTVHATSALGIIERFLDFGLSRSVLGAPDFLTGLLYQKLVPILCTNCSIDLKELVGSEDSTVEDLALYDRISGTVGSNINKATLKLRHHEGCPECNYQGITGRSVCAEVIMIDLNMIEKIASGDTIGLIKYWRGLSDLNPFSLNMRGKTCMEHGFQKVLDGLVCPYDLEASFKPINEMLLENKKSSNKDEGNNSSLEKGWNDL